MTHEYSYAQICAQVNSALNIKELMEFIGWHPEKLVRSGDVYLGLCPIHRDEVFRTLVLNPRNNTYECKHVHCPGNAPSDLLDLMVKATGRSLPEVILALAEEFGVEYFKLTERQLNFLHDLAEQVRLYHENALANEADGQEFDD